MLYKGGVHFWNSFRIIVHVIIYTDLEFVD